MLASNVDWTGIESSQTTDRCNRQHDALPILRGQSAHGDTSQLDRMIEIDVRLSIVVIFRIVPKVGEFLSSVSYMVSYQLDRLQVIDVQAQTLQHRQHRHQALSQTSP